MRKFRMSIILLIVGVSGSLLQAQDKYTTNQPSIKLTTGKESGKWQFNIYMDKADQAYNSQNDNYLRQGYGLFLLL